MMKNPIFDSWKWGVDLYTSKYGTSYFIGNYVGPNKGHVSIAREAKPNGLLTRKVQVF